MIDTWKQSVLAAVAVIVAVLIAAALQRWTLDRSSQAVLVWAENAAPSSFPDQHTALAYASRIAGFEITAPTYLPSGYALVEIDVAGIDARSGKAARACFTVVRGQPHQIDPVPRIVEPPGFCPTLLSAQPGFHMSLSVGRLIDKMGVGPTLAKPSPTSEVHLAGLYEGVTYSLLKFLPDHETYVVEIETGFPSAITQAEAVQILSSVPE